MKVPFLKINIEKKTRSNSFYRKVIFTTKTMQLVLMSLKPGIEIGKGPGKAGGEKHSKTTQFIRIEKGTGIAIIANKKLSLKDGDAIMIKPNTYHNIINTGKTPLKLYTLYSPPEHAPNVKTRDKNTKMKNKK